MVASWMASQRSAAYGWRAAFRPLCHTYYGKYKLRTIRDIITRWAPPKENNTEAYIRRVTDRIGIGPDKELGDPQTHPNQKWSIGYTLQYETAFKTKNHFGTIGIAF